MGIRVRAGAACAVLALLVGFALGGTAALAHAEYERSNPPADGTVREAPERLDIWFTQEIFRQEGANAIEVTGPDGSRVDTGDVTLDDADRHHLSVGLQPDLPPGRYTVNWTNLSAEDGDSHAGSFAFTVDPAAQPTEEPPTRPAGPGAGPGGVEASPSPGSEAGEEAPDGEGRDGGSGWALPVVLGVAALAVVGGGVLVLIWVRQSPGE